MQTQIKIDTKYTKNYATRANAEKAALAQLEKIKSAIQDSKINPRFIVATCGDKDDRFAPAFLNTGYTAGYFAHDGFMVIGS